MLFRNLSLIAGVAFALAGCGPETYTKPGASQQDYDLARTQCEAQAWAQLPAAPATTQIVAGYYSSSGINCVKNDHGSHDCNPTQKWNPPVYGSKDANADGRATIVRACMMNGGWQRQSS